MESIARSIIKLLRSAALTLSSVAVFALTTYCSLVIPKPDLTEYLKKTMPEGVQLTDVSYEVLPTQKASNDGSISIRAEIKATATEDLFSIPTDPADIKKVNDYISFYNTYAMWTNAFLYTPYADELKQSAPKIDPGIPIFLHRDQLKGDTFTGSCDVSAKQMAANRWSFSPITGIDWGSKKPGSVSSSFGGKWVGANGPDGQAAVQQFTSNESTITQFKKKFTEKHAAESQPLVTALKPFLTGGQEIQAFAIYPDETVPDDKFTFSHYDPQTNHCRVRFQGTLGDFMGSGEIVGSSLLIFQDGSDSAPSGTTAFVGNFDPKTGDITLRQRPPEDMADEIIHTHGK